MFEIQRNTSNVWYYGVVAYVYNFPFYINAVKTYLVLNMNISLNNYIIRLHFDTQANEANYEHIFIVELYCFEKRM